MLDLHNKVKIINLYIWEILDDLAVLFRKKLSAAANGPSLIQLGLNQWDFHKILAAKQNSSVVAADICRKVNLL